jgi:acyl-coenzyme A thioesterase PaaI-like protein
MPFANLPQKLSAALAGGDRNFIRELWDRCHPLPGGTRLFSRVLDLAVPYTGSIRAHVLELAPGRSRVVMQDRRAVRNHLSSVHAVALANLAEFTGNLAVAYALPDDARFIVKGLSLDYLKKARGPITGQCSIPVPLTAERQEYDVEVSLSDQQGDVVTRAVLKTLVGPKRSSAASQK